LVVGRDAQIVLRGLRDATARIRPTLSATKVVARHAALPVHTAEHSTHARAGHAAHPASRRATHTVGTAHHAPAQPGDLPLCLSRQHCPRRLGLAGSRWPQGCLHALRGTGEAHGGRAHRALLCQRGRDQRNGASDRRRPQLRGCRWRFRIGCDPSGSQELDPMGANQRGRAEAANRQSADRCRRMCSISRAPRPGWCWMGSSCRSRSARRGRSA